MIHAIPRQRHLHAAQAVDLGVLYTTISAGMLLVRRYLTGRGIDQDFADRYGSAFGRNAAKIYRAVNGAEPRRAWSLVSGKWRRVNGYLPAEADVLDEAFASYPRTAEYVVTAEPATEPSPVEVSSKGTGDCRIPGCEGTWHYDGACVVPLGEVAFDGEDSGLPAELVSDESGPHLVVFAYDLASMNLRREMRDQAAAQSFAQQLRELADAIDGAARHLPAAS